MRESQIRVRTSEYLQLKCFESRDLSATRTPGASEEFDHNLTLLSSLRHILDFFELSHDIALKLLQPFKDVGNA